MFKKFYNSDLCEHLMIITTIVMIMVAIFVGGYTVGTLRAKRAADVQTAQLTVQINDQIAAKLRTYPCNRDKAATQPPVWPATQAAWSTDSRGVYHPMGGRAAFEDLEDIANGRALGRPTIEDVASGRYDIDGRRR
jgi:hypothetical protein